MYDFTKKAIRCETWEQMQELERLAKEQGLRTYLTKWGEVSETIFFSKSTMADDLYSNYCVVEPHETIVEYSDFIASTTHPHQSVEGC